MAQRMIPVRRGKLVLGSRRPDAAPPAPPPVPQREEDDLAYSIVTGLAAVYLVGMALVDLLGWIDAPAFVAGNLLIHLFRFMIGAAACVILCLLFPLGLGQRSR